MNEHGSKDGNGKQSVSEMTPEQVRRAIAERHQGSYVEKRGSVWAVVIDGITVREYTKRAWAEKHLLAQIPDWPNDSGKALELCLEIGARYSFTLDMVQDKHGVSALFRPIPKIYIVRANEAGATPALALSRLALAALEGEGGDT